MAENAIFHSDKGAQYASRLLAEWARANDVRLSWQPHRQLPRQRGSRVLLHDVEERDILQEVIRDPRRGQVRVDRVHRILLQQAPAHSPIGYQVPAEVMDAFFERTAPKPEEAPLAA